MQIIHRFTPPTCTLEIWGKNSPLSRWTKQQVIKNLRFNLSFDDPRTPEEEQVSISGDRKQLEQIYSLVLDHTENFLQQSFSPKFLAVSAFSEKSNISEPDSWVCPELVNYELNVGDIINKDSPQKIKLSSLQLFDLVAALEEYKSEIAVVAELEETSKKAIIPLWTKIAAGLIFTVGLTNVVLQLSQETTISKSTNSSQEAENQLPQPLAKALDVIPPQVPNTEIKPTPEPKITEPLSSAETLPPPPAIDLPKPPPNIPNPENYSLPEVGKTIAPEIASFPDLKPPPLEQQISSSSQSEPKLPQVESNIIVPQQDQEVIVPQQDQEDKNTESRTLDIPVTNDNESATTAKGEQQIALNPEKTIDDYIRDRLSRESLSNSTIEESKTNTNNNVVDITAAKPSTNIAEMTQAKEIKSYFEQKWQPPEELTRTLEYRLVLNKNGSIKRIIPIGKASEVYIDRTNLPLRGETFVTPLKNTDQATIRLILGPDGDVNTFLE